jgi:hypothetical protein
MKKEALLVYGEPLAEEKAEKFKRFVGEGIDAMKRVALASGYKIQIIPLSKLDVLDLNGLSDQFLFYYIGHANGELDILGNESEARSLVRIISSIDQIVQGEKMIVLDSCTDDFVETYPHKKGTKLFGSFDVYFDRCLGISFYDAVIARKKKLEEIDKKTFQEMNHTWIKTSKN